MPGAVVPSAAIALSMSGAVVPVAALSRSMPGAVVPSAAIARSMPGAVVPSAPPAALAASPRCFPAAPARRALIGRRLGRAHARPLEAPGRAAPLAPVPPEPPQPPPQRHWHPAPRRCAGPPPGPARSLAEERSDTCVRPPALTSRGARVTSRRCGEGAARGRFNGRGEAEAAPGLGRAWGHNGAGEGRVSLERGQRGWAGQGCRCRGSHGPGAAGACGAGSPPNPVIPSVPRLLSPPYPGYRPRIPVIIAPVPQFWPPGSRPGAPVLAPELRGCSSGKGAPGARGRCR